MTTYATTDDIEKEIGRPPLDEAEKDQWAQWLKFAENELNERFNGHLTELVNAGTLRKETVRKTEINAVARKVTNPEGKKTVRIDDYSSTVDESRASGEVRVSNDEWEELSPALRGAVFSVRASGATPVRIEVPRTCQ